MKLTVLATKQALTLKTIALKVIQQPSSSHFSQQHQQLQFQSMNYFVGQKLTFTNWESFFKECGLGEEDSKQYASEFRLVLVNKVVIVVVVLILIIELFDANSVDVAL